MNRTEKAEAIGTLHQAFLDHPLVIVTHYTGMTVAELGEFRAKMRETGASFKVTKNRLTKLALKGTPFEGLDEQFRGPTAVAFATDPVPTAKAVLDYAKTNEKLKVLCGGLESSVIDEKGLDALSKMPPIEELRAKILGALVQPASKLAMILNQPAAKLVRQLGAPNQQLAGVLQAYAQKAEAA